MSEGRKFFGVSIPFAEHCGVEPVRWGDGEAEIAVSIEERHANSIGMAHGGVLLTLLDIAMANACRSSLPQDTTVMTVDMHSSFLAPARGALTARGRIVRKGKAILFAEGEVLDASGAVCARSSGVFRPTQARPGGARGGDG